jgi:hypothetical protein
VVAEAGGVPSASHWGGIGAFRTSL